jgi:hypothetical protein
MEVAEQPAAQALAGSFKTIDDSSRGKHEAVLDYWLSIRGGRELPPLRDLDPLKISEAAPSSVLLELIGGGEDAEIRHVGERLKGGAEVDKIASAPRPSMLASIARKLSIVAISRNFLAFEDEFSADGSSTRCWVTLLPLSSAGAWVDYVYAFVTHETVEGAFAAAPVVEEADEPEVALEPDEPVAEVEEDVLELDSPVEEGEEIAGIADSAETAEVVEEPEQVLEAVDVVEEPAAEEPVKAPPAKKDTGFAFDAKAGGFYATKAVKVKPSLPAAAPAKTKASPVEEEVPAPPPVAEAPAPTAEPEAPAEEAVAEAPIEEAIAEAAPAPKEAKPAAEEKPKHSNPASEGTLQSKLTEVRAKADEARMAKLRANAALYEGLSAAYDFALDAEEAPEEYLKIVEAQGLKIQLRAPMRPVVKLAFEGMCDDAMITHLEAVLAWALDQELPRGSLAKRIEDAGGIGPILSGQAEAA